MVKVRPEFWINYEKFKFYDDKAWKYLEKSFKLPMNSIDFTILRLLHKKYSALSLKYIQMASKELTLSVKK